MAKTIGHHAKANGAFKLNYSQAEAPEIHHVHYKKRVVLMSSWSLRPELFRRLQPRPPDFVVAEAAISGRSLSNDQH